MNHVEIERQFYENILYYVILFRRTLLKSGAFSVNTVINSYRNASTDMLDSYNMSVDPFL